VALYVIDGSTASAQKQIDHDVILIDVILLVNGVNIIYKNYHNNYERV